MNIQELAQKVKALGERFNTREMYTVLLIMVVAFGSFGLGRLSKLQASKQPIRLEQSAAVLGTSVLGVGNTRPTSSPMAKGKTLDAPSAPVGGGQFVASKGGTKYHFPWCSGAQRISEANKIWFASVEEARKAGYTPASNCKGLK